MGSNSAQKKFSTNFSIFKMFKPRRPMRGDAAWEDLVTVPKVWPSDEDKGWCVAEPGIDRKASAFIAKFHKSCVPESECQIYQAANA